MKAKQELSHTSQNEVCCVPETETKVYHIIYEPSFKSVVFHHWTDCNLKCKGCFCKYEKLDFSLFPDWQDNLEKKGAETNPEKFLTIGEIIEKTKDFDIQRAVFIGTEPSLDKGLPVLAKEMHRIFNCHNILFTNGVKLADYSDIDEIIFSIKAYSADIYEDYTERSNAKMLENFAHIAKSGMKLQAEVLLIPGVIDACEVEKVAEFIASVDDNIPLRIDGYFPIKDCGWRAATGKEVEAAAAAAKKYLKTVNFLSGEMERIGEDTIKVF